MNGEIVGDGAAGCRITAYHSLGLEGAVTAVAGTVAGPNGRFVLSDVPWFRGIDWLHSYVIVTAQARDRVGLLQVRGDERAARTEIELRPTCRLRGVVVDDASGRPIVDASVWPMVFGDPASSEPVIWPTEPLLPWLAHTDADGRFELRDVPVYAGYVLVVSAPEHGRRLVRVKDTAQPSQVRLAPAGRIAGSVRLADGAAGAGLVVWASGDRDGFARTTTDTAGRFSFGSLSAETYCVSTIAAEGPTVLATGIVVEAGSTVSDVELRFSATGWVVGRVLDGVNATTIERGAVARVSAIGPEDRRQRVDSLAPIRADGSFRIAVAAGRNRLTVVVPGWSVAAVHTEVRAGEQTTLDVPLRRGAHPRRR